MSLRIEELGRLMAARRGARGVRAAAAEAGISSATFSRVENGHMPDLETFAKICKWLGKDPREFLGFEREDVAPPQAVVQFKKDRTISRDTAVALGELILSAQNAMRARAKLIEWPLRYGFKAQAERISVTARQALNISALARLDAKQYAAHVGVHILTVNELDLSDESRRQLLEVDPTSWSGMTIRESGLVGVLVNPTHSPERQASTMMHELSHVVLKHIPVRVDISSAGILLVSEYSENDEDEANWLSGALLLPRDALKHYREKGWPAAKITAHFGVSQQMYDWRIRMTGVDIQMRRAKVPL